MDYIEEAKKLMKSHNSTCVALKQGQEYVSTLKGVAPLLQPLVKDIEFFQGSYVVDRVIGKAAAILLIKGQIKQLHAIMLSKHAKKILEQYAISYTYDELVEHIINRDGTDMCPMEKAVLEIDDIEQGFWVIQETVEKLHKLRS